MALKTIRLQLRFLVPLVATLIGASYLAVPLMDQVTLRWFSRDLNSRGLLVANAISDSVADALAGGRVQRLRDLLDRTAQDERLFALALCTPDGRVLAATERYPSQLGCTQAMEIAQRATPQLALAGGGVHVGMQQIFGQPQTMPTTPQRRTPSGTQVDGVDAVPPGGGSPGGSIEPPSTAAGRCGGGALSPGTTASACASRATCGSGPPSR